MPRSYNAAVQSALDAGRVVDRLLVELDFASGLYGFWSGLGPFVWNGITHVGAGSLISIEGIKQTSDLSAVAVVGRLSSLSPAVLATIENEVYHQRPCVISTAYFNAETYALLNVEVEYRGYIDRIVHVEKTGGEAALEVHLESRFRDHLKTGYRVRSDQDQRNLFPTDDSLKHVTVVVTEKVTFGQVTAGTASTAVAPVKKQSGISGFLGRIFG